MISIKDVTLILIVTLIVAFGKWGLDVQHRMAERAYIGGRFGEDYCLNVWTGKMRPFREVPNCMD